jgi:hypothetical protein
MPRMRGISDLTFYRPAKSFRYEHIDALFTGDVDWDLIATHARDMIQVVDMTAVLSSMAADGHTVTPDLVACASPYIRGHILRFGQYALDMGDTPPPLDPQPLPFEIN